MAGASCSGATGTRFPVPGKVGGTAKTRVADGRSFEGNFSSGQRAEVETQWGREVHVLTK